MYLQEVQQGRLQVRPPGGCYLQVYLRQVTGMHCAGSDVRDSHANMVSLAYAAVGCKA